MGYSCMAKTTSPSFVFSLELEKNPIVFSVIEKELEIARVIYNTVLGKYLKLEEQMKREKRYKKLVLQNRGVSKKLAKDPSNKILIAEKKCIQAAFEELRLKYALTEYASHEWIKPIREHFGNKVNSAIAQKTATRAWNTFKKKLFGESKKVKFISKGDMDSFEGKSNDTGWRFVDGFIVYKDLNTSLVFKEKDAYASEIMTKLYDKTPFSYKTKDSVKSDYYRVKYVRIVRKEIRGKVRYFADLVIAGYPPSKDRNIGKGNVGIDIGTSTVAVSSETKVLLSNLAEQVKEIAREIRLIQRKMDRSRRMMNSSNFNDNGTIKKGKKTWVFSNRYRKLRSRLRELHRKQADIRKTSHRTLANSLLSIGDTFYTETMNFKGLQKRKRETEVSDKTGKYKRKKRFGKTLGNRAPALFLKILEEKVNRFGGIFKRINTRTFKASQYCHVRKDYFRKHLSERWHRIDEKTKIQRDIYSAFLLMNANKSGKKTNQNSCEETFPTFQKLHDQEIAYILKQKKMILNSGITLKN